MRERRRITLHGAVQGVGYRPFVYRLASELELSGWVLNSSAGLIAEVEGAPARVTEFERRVLEEHPAPAVILDCDSVALEPVGDAGFEIRSSDAGEAKTVPVLPDLATCPQCLTELWSGADRRHLYPFTNCTLCGPRYSIVLDVPYDRPNTTMRGFAMCGECSREYGDPGDRRFHAQPNACPRCGPALEVTAPSRSRLSRNLQSAADTLASGGIVALKGIGGFQLLADARNESAVERLRARKHREEKPFAVLMPSLAAAREWCQIGSAEQRLLESPAAPIVLLRPTGAEGLAKSVAKASPYIGAMLPYSPLHHLLTRAFPHPLICTSGNQSDEPIAIDNEEAQARLGGIADLFVLHDRPIARPCDDSVVRVVRGRESVVRRARGYAPLPVRVPKALPRVLAVGGHMKNSVAIAIGREVTVSQHIGDLDTLESREAFKRAIADLCRLYRFEPELIACDLHPDYASTRWARQQGLPVIEVQHHHAHAAACAAENGVEGEYLAISWDGTGYGTDGVVWGSEIFLVTESCQFRRVAHLRPFRLPGGEAAVKEGWRTALSLMLASGVKPPEHLWSTAVAHMVERGINSPFTTSMGRLFDAVAAIAGVARRNAFEGQAAMTLEASLTDARETYPLGEDGDWRPLIQELFADPRDAAARFHNALVEWAVAVTNREGARQVVLSGGSFQNRYLTEQISTRLESCGIRVFTHMRVPPNDGGIALGQAVLAGCGLYNPHQKHRYDSNC